MKTIIFTGGGTAGHVTPNLALIEKLPKNNYQVFYIGSNKSIEETISKSANIPFIAIQSGKLRRYFSLKNFLDPFKILLGIIQAYYHLTRLKPNVIFSKGGFVSFPVVIAGSLKKIPIIIHESDMTPGLANRLSFPFATTICVTFAETKKFFKQNKKLVLAGTPIRNGFFVGNKQKGLIFLNFEEQKPLLLVIGGSAGAEVLNKVIRDNLLELTKQYYICHICGKGKMDLQIINNNYRQYDYLNEELFDVMAAADIVLSRSGANSLLELIALQKLHILVPLSKKVSRGDQIDNALYFANKGISKIIWEEDLTKETLFNALKDLQDNRTEYQEARAKYDYQSGNEIIYNLLINTCT